MAEGPAMLLEVILYVHDQQASTDFYRRLFAYEPVLNVPGMTEFMLAGGAKLGLMPSSGIAKLLGDATPHPDEGTGVPRCELYLGVTDPGPAYRHALSIGATPVSPASLRGWGDVVAYVADPDGHIIAFAKGEPPEH